MQLKERIITLYLFLYVTVVIEAGYREERSGSWSDWIGENETCEQPHTPKYGEIHLPIGTKIGGKVFYSCYIGYNLNGLPYRACLQNGSWEGVAPTCVKKECDAGTYGEECKGTCGHCRAGSCDAVTGLCPGGCRAGYQGGKCLQPCRNGTYGMDCVHRCICENDQPCNKINGFCFCGITKISNGETVERVQGATATVIYHCLAGFELLGNAELTCNRSTGVWDHTVPRCAKRGGSTMCPDDVDHRGTRWPKALPDTVRTLQCPVGFSGNVSRRCSSDGTWRRPNYYCVRGSVEAIRAMTSTIQENATKAEVVDALQGIASLTALNGQQNATLGTNDQLTGGELTMLSESLGDVATVLSNSPDKVDDHITDTFLESVSNLVDNTHKESWMALNEANGAGASQVLLAMQSFSDALSNSVNSSNEQKKTFVKTNLAIEVSKVSNNDVTFPREDISNNVSDWIKATKSEIRLDASTFKDSSEQYVTTAIMYRNMSKILPSKTSSKINSGSSKDEDERINAPILALSISPSLGAVLDPPVVISFEHKHNELTSPSCRFWLFQSGSSGYWSNTGCSVNFTNTTYTVCECNHLTNFAVLMSPFQEADVDSVGLRVVSMIGIGISIFCLLATLAMHILLWKYLKSDRTALLANLCVALVLSYVLFLAGVDRTENSIVCAVIAACLHYIYLVVFCIMLAEGIEMAITVLYVFKTKVSRIRWLLLLSWLLPAVIVGISLGVTKTDGYGNERFCWLSNDQGLIWAFVGPTLTIILFNIGCLVLVLRAIFNSRTVEAKESSEKIKTGVRSLCVLLPVTGVSWILGMFYVSEDMAFIQYIFAICNGSQGFFLFLFHCLLSPQVKRAFLLRKRKKYAVTSMEKSISKSTSKLDNSISERETGESFTDMNSIESYSTEKMENGHRGQQNNKN